MGDLAKARTGLIAALDIGSSKICCFIAHANEEGGIRVLGLGHHAADGVRSGTINDMEAAQASILTAVTAAEEHAGERIRDVIVNVSGGNPASMSYGVEVPITGHEVGEADLRRVHGQTLSIEQRDDRKVIHRIPVDYAIDGSRGIRDPRGMFGDALSVSMHVVAAGAGALRNMTTCVAKCHLDISDMVVSPYASGLACLVEDEIDLGATLVDMGGGTTTIAVFYNGHVVHTDSIPVGGSHVTNDVARGLSTPIYHAERMKTLYGGCIPSPSYEREVIDVPLIGEENRHQPNHVPRSILIGIIRPRLEETFELVRSRLEASGMDRLAGRRMVLTGGASLLAGARELAALVLEKQVRIGRPLRLSGLAEATSGPAFSTCAGLLRFGTRAHGDVREATRMGAEIYGNPLGRLGSWLKENF